MVCVCVCTRAHVFIPALIRLPSQLPSVLSEGDEIPFKTKGKKGLGMTEAGSGKSYLEKKKKKATETCRLGSYLLVLLSSTSFVERRV